MWRYLYRLIKCKNRFRQIILFLLFFSFVSYIFVHQNLSRTNYNSSIIFFQSSTPSIHTHDFILYPESRSAIEYERIQIDNNNIRSTFFRNQIYPKENIDYSKALEYSESTFRSASIPIIWLDAHGDIHWNRIAQSEALNYLLEKQFPTNIPKSNPTAIINNCLSRPLFLLDQWLMGFFSRYHCLIEQFGQTLYSSKMVLLIPRPFVVSESSRDDFQNEGILRYFQPISLCSAYLHHPQMKPIHELFRMITMPFNDRKTINNVHQLLERDEQTIKYKYSREIWKFGSDHVPHRRWLFDRNRYKIKKILTYNSPIKLLIDHSNEHIYFYNGTLLNLTNWTPRNSPQGSPTNVLPGTTTNLTIHDQIFTSFLRYMLLLFFSPLSPRIQTLEKLLAHHWSEYLSDKYNKPYNTSLLNMAVLFIRRGDKMSEDSFWQKHNYWRNISMYVKGLIDDEKRRSKNYSSIFIMTDDKDVMNSIEEYSRDGLVNKTQDEQYARRYLYEREILYNIFAPQSCFDPFIRIGFDQFLVNVQFILNHASLVIGHNDSNVGRYLEEIIYVNRQHQIDIQTSTYVRNAPDTLD